MRKQKPVADSFVIMTGLVLPNDTNTLNNLMGGRSLAPAPRLYCSAISFLLTWFGTKMSERRRAKLPLLQKDISKKAGAAGLTAE